MKTLLRITLAVTVLISLSFIPKSKKTIILDVGHGGMDLGSIHDGLSEKDIVLSIAKKVQDLNSDKKLDIILTRDVDHFVSLNDRVQFANGKTPDFLLSLHANYTSKADVNGFKIYVKENFLTDESLLFANAIEYEYPSEIEKRATKTARFHVLKNSTCPAALLEVGFLSNENDRNYLLSEEGQWEIAKAIYKALK